MARHQVKESTYRLQVPVNQQELGRLIGQAGTDWRRMGLSFLVRLAVVALATVVLFGRGDFDLANLTDQIVLIIYAVVLLYPLLHCRDTMEFYENGIAFKGKPYLFQTDQVTWRRHSGTGFFLAATRLHLAGGPKNGINVSYVQNAQETFTRLYVSGAARRGD